MTDDLLGEIKKLKKDAKTFRDLGDNKGALAKIGEAIAKLTAAKTASDGSVDAELDAQLADSWGIKGGLLRRANRLVESRDAYKTGLTFEVGDSYNLTNSIVLELLINPDGFDEMKDRIESARVEVRRQIYEQVPSRKGQWWAFADLGLLELLSENEGNAEDAYRNFAATGARASDYESTITVLEELARRLDTAKPVISACLKRGVAFLKRSR